ncbi:MAG: tetratricopeptide repeat protein [Candidatus Hydrogenedentes bacterium]|nr:tetratricopeptide repeat protein [Candidatus Hydrogenedentota bacterium]
MAFGGETADSYYDEGITASMRGDLPAAVQHFEKVLQIDRSYFAAYHQLAKCHIRMGEAGRAAKLLRQVIAVKPNQIPPRVDLGFALLDLGDIGQAREVLGEVANAKPDNARATLGLAICAFREGNWAAAGELAQRSINLGGSNFAAVFLLGKAAKLAGFIEQSFDALSQADALMKNSIESNPEPPEAYFLRGEVNFVRDNYTEALDNYRAAEDRAEGNRHYSAYGEHFTRLDILAKRGLCLQRLGRVQAAREVGVQILGSDPQHKLGAFLKNLEEPGKPA